MPSCRNINPDDVWKVPGSSFNPGRITDRIIRFGSALLNMALFILCLSGHTQAWHGIYRRGEACDLIDYTMRSIWPKMMQTLA